MAHIRLTDLIETHIIQQLQDAFSEYTEMSVYTCDTEGNKITTISRDTDHCRLFFRTNVAGNERCQECRDTNLKRTLETGETTRFQCHAGLTEFIAPIILNGEVIGCFVGAQMNDGTISSEQLQTNARTYGFDENAYMDAFSKLPVLNTEKIDAAAKLLCALADVVSQQAYSSYMAIREIEKLESNSASQSAFIMNMHDNIKSQMTQIMMQSGEALKSHNPDRMSDTFQDFMLTFPEWIAGYDEVAEFASMTDVKLELDEEIYSLREVLDRMVVYADSRMGMEHVSAIISIDDEVGDQYMGDAGRLLQILNKFVVETSKKSSDGEMQVSVRTQKNSYATCICMDVSMCIDEMNGLMEQEYQNKNSDNVIASAGQLIRQMEGTIRVSRPDDNHVTFHIEIPQLAVS